VTVVVAAVIVQSERILIAQRKKVGYHPLKWEFPGGKVEATETPQTALLRELKEELGIAAQIDRELMCYAYQYPGRSPILLIFYRVVDFTGALQNLDFEEIRWENPERLADYDFLEGDREFIARLPEIAISPQPEV
jgi:8-oxo-dGTP diphosphatase